MWLHILPAVTVRHRLIGIAREKKGLSREGETLKQANNKWSLPLPLTIALE